MRGIKNQLVGRRFGLLTVFAEAMTRGKRTYWRCRCDCGTEVIRDGHDLVRPPHTKQAWTHSCGCRKQLALDIGRMLGGPGKIAGSPEHRNYRGQGKRTS